MAEIIDLAKRMAIAPETRHVLALMKAGPEVELALAAVVGSMGRVEQRALITVTAFRMMGAMVPIEITLLEHMPPLRGISDQEIMAALQKLVDTGVLMIAEPSETSPHGGFYWPALERLVSDALRYYETPAIVGIDGNAIR